MTLTSHTQVLPFGDTPSVLFISGVSISPTAHLQGDGRPTPDYIALLEQLQLDVLSPETIGEERNPLIHFLHKRLGLQVAIATAAALRAHRYNVVFAAAEDVGLNFALLRRAFGIRTPLVMSCNNVGTRRPAFILGKLKQHTAIRSFLCLSESQAQLLMDDYGVPEGKLCITSNSVDHQYFRPMPEVPVKRQICSAGMAHRDYASLVEATRGMDVDLLIDANSAWWQSSLNISDAMLHERVTVLTGRSTSELRQLYAESLFVVLPLENAPYGVGYTTSLEAMAMGKALIVSKLRQYGDFIKDGWNGIYVPPEDPVALRAAIQQLLDHPEEARRLGENARRTVEERFTLAHYAQRVVTGVHSAVGIGVSLAT